MVLELRGNRVHIWKYLYELIRKGFSNIVILKAYNSISIESRLMTEHSLYLDSSYLQSADSL